MSDTPRSLLRASLNQHKDWLRNYPETGSTAAGHNVDEHTSAVEEDSILYLNLQLLDFPDALAQWSEFKDVNCAISEDMFTRPNKKALHVVLYFLFAELLGRDATHKYFLKCWPTKAEAKLERDFKLGAVEWIKTYGTEWEIPQDKVACVASMLQRHAGLKLVELLCGMSHMALLRRFEKRFPDKKHLVASMRDPIPGAKLGLDAAGESEALAGISIAARKSKVSILQKRFVELAGMLKANQASHDAAVGKILEEHALMSVEAEGLNRTTNALRETLEGDANPQRQRNLSKFTKELENSLAQVADFGAYLNRVLEEPWDDAHRITRETMGVEEEGENGGDAGNVDGIKRRASNARAESRSRPRREDNGDSADYPFTSLVSLMVPNMKEIQEMSNVGMEGTLETTPGLQHNQSIAGPASMESPEPQRSFPSTAHRPAGVFGNPGLGFTKGDHGVGKLSGSVIQGGQEEEDASPPVAVLTDVIEAWHKSLKDLQNSLAPLQNSRQHRSLLREVLGSSSSSVAAMGVEQTQETLLSDVDSLDVLAQGLIDEGDRLDDEIDRLRAQLGPLNEQVLAMPPCEHDFVVNANFRDGL